MNPWGSLRPGTYTAPVSSKPAHRGIRRPADWFEVRSNGKDAVLLGWIKGIAGDKVEGDHLELYAAPAAEDLEYVEETEGGGTNIKVSEIGELKAYRVREHATHFPAALIAEKAYEKSTPAYARREFFRNGGAHYYWRALSVSADEAQDLFEFDEFEPYEPELTLSEQDVLSDWLDEERRFFEPAPTIITGGTINASTIAAGSISAAKITSGSILATKISGPPSSLRTFSGLPSPDSHDDGETVYDTLTHRMWRLTDGYWEDVNPPAATTASAGFVP